MLEKLEGYKTYLGIILMLISAVLNKLGYIDAETFNTIMTTLAGLTAIAWKAASNRTEETLKTTLKELKEFKEKSLK